MGNIIETPNYNVHVNSEDAMFTVFQKGNYSKVFLLVDENTEQYCLPYVLEYLPEDAVIIQIQSGELHKDLETCKLIWKSLLDNMADRNSLLINLGGGVVGDMGGFCASTYMRGIDFVQMPTTLLSQVDSSIGSKLGIDFNGIKNSIGVFNNPQAVIINTELLKTLPFKELLSGFAEIIKHSLIQDKDMWEHIKGKKQIALEDVEQLITKNIAIKNKVVNEDPYENGLRKILNFGHTIGHAIEALLLDSEDEMLHGEAIAIGMVCESYLSYLKGNISLEECTEIKKYIHQHFGNKYKSLPKPETIIQLMKHDKKNIGGKIQFSLLQKIGESNYNQEVSEEEIGFSLDWYCKR